MIVPSVGFVYDLCMKKLLLGTAFLVASAVSVAAGENGLSLKPVPYALSMPETITSHLSTGETTGPFTKEVREAGATASTLVYYQPENGEKTILMAVYYFPADKFDAAKKPDEPPRFGDEVIRKDGMVLSIAGPHDTIYEPDTPDGKNVIRASELMYEAQTYLPR